MVVTPEGFPAGVDELLESIAADGFAVWRIGSAALPEMCGAYFRWADGCVDLMVVRDFRREVCAARAVRGPTGAEVDPLAPERVVWSYRGRPRRVLQGLLDLPHPEHPRVGVAIQAHRYLIVGRGEQRPLTIRPPAPGRAAVRAARLAGGRP